MITYDRLSPKYVQCDVREAKKEGRTFGSSRKLKLWRKRNKVAAYRWVRYV